MNIEDFWNQAFLAALSRLPAAKAKKEADLATLMCIDHWKAHQREYAPQYLTKWQHQEIGLVPLLIDEMPTPSRQTLKARVRTKTTVRKASKKAASS